MAITWSEPEWIDDKELSPEEKAFLDNWDSWCKFVNEHLDHYEGYSCL